MQTLMEHESMHEWTVGRLQDLVLLNSSMKRTVTMHSLSDRLSWLSPPVRFF